MISDVLGYIVVLWVDPGPNVDLNAQIVLYGLNAHYCMSYLLLPVGLPGNVNQTFWLQ